MGRILAEACVVDALADGGQADPAVDIVVLGVRTDSEEVLSRVGNREHFSVTGDIGKSSPISIRSATGERVAIALCNADTASDAFIRASN